MTRIHRKLMHRRSLWPLFALLAIASLLFAQVTRTRGQDAVREPLSTLIDLQFRDVPLRIALDEIAKRIDLTVRLHADVLMGEADLLNAPITFEPTQAISAKSFLMVILPEELSVDVQDSAVLFVHERDIMRQSKSFIHPFCGM